MSVAANRRRATNACARDRRPRDAGRAAALACAVLLAAACGDSVRSFIPDAEVPVQLVWTVVEGGPAVNWYAVTGSGSDDVLLVGEQGAIARWDGAELAIERPPAADQAALHAVFELDRWHAWAVGDAGEVWRFNGTGAGGDAGPYDPAAGPEGWSRVEHGLAVARSLMGVWADATDVFAVGEAATVVHFDGTAWELVPTDSPDDLFAVTRHGSEVFAVGTLGSVLRYDGTDFHRQGIRGYQGTLAGATSGPGGTWVVGLDGALFRYDGSFQAIDGLPAAFLRAVSATSDSVFVAGWDSTVARVRSGHVLAYEHIPERWLNGVFAAADCDVWVAGASGMILHGPPPGLPPDPDSGVEPVDGGCL